MQHPQSHDRSGISPLFPSVILICAKSCTKVIKRVLFFRVKPRSTNCSHRVRYYYLVPSVKRVPRCSPAGLWLHLVGRHCQGNFLDLGPKWPVRCVDSSDVTLDSQSNAVKVRYQDKHVMPDVRKSSNVGNVNDGSVPDGNMPSPGRGKLSPSPPTRNQTLANPTLPR